MEEGGRVIRLDDFNLSNCNLSGLAREKGRLQRDQIRCWHFRWFCKPNSVHNNSGHTERLAEPPLVPRRRTQRRKRRNTVLISSLPGGRKRGEGGGTDPLTGIPVLRTVFPDEEA